MTSVASHLISYLSPIDRLTSILIRIYLYQLLLIFSYATHITHSSTHYVRRAATRRPCGIVYDCSSYTYQIYALYALYCQFLKFQGGIAFSWRYSVIPEPSFTGHLVFMF